MFPELLRIGSFTLYSYGLLVALAFLTGLLVASRLARRAGLDPDRISSLGVYVAIAAIVGAKLLLLVSDFSYYTKRPREIFSLATLQAGGVFYGGLLAALLIAAWMMRRWRLPAWRTADTFAPAIAVGHAIGRTGCFLAGCCWGKATKLPWGVTFTDPVARETVGVPLGVPLHPTQLYEAAAELVIFAVLLWRFRRPHADGAIIGLYLLLYSLVRLGLEFLRDPQNRSFPLSGPLSGTQWIAVLLIAVGIALLVRQPPREIPTKA